MVVCEYSRLSLAPATACKTRRETKVSASQRKCTQGLTKRSRKQTQVFNLRLLVSPFGQGLKLPCADLILDKT